MFFGQFVGRGFHAAPMKNDVEWIRGQAWKPDPTGEYEQTVTNQIAVTGAFWILNFKIKAN